MPGDRRFRTNAPGNWKFCGVFHDVSAETGSVEYGTEIDASLGRSFAKNYGVLFNGAFFSGDTASFPDTNKFWVLLAASY